ncbi:PilZ domain-containing protein [Roseibium limicola]|uniref:PilZ domain-containing protein n=1 Tax=Roseibium limicola TaxID=2816037 RepID=A0A939EJL5_9HYPH|nr:PilZ domain-containing protein [Roseibium limicola]MBO0343617.1 PilZ domain-containing protein [Roseibium limicola]
MPSIEALHEREQSGEPVLVVDFDNLCCVEATVENVSEWGCRLSGPDMGELRKNIGIRVPGILRLIRGQVTAVKGELASIIFPKIEEKLSDKRRERRNTVKIPVTISDREGVTEIKGTIIDAGPNGCKVLAKDLTSLPEEVVLHIKKFEKPVLGEFAWRNSTSAGLRLVWEDGEMPSE